MILISDAVNRLLPSTQGVKALLRACLFAHRDHYSIPSDSLDLLMAAGLFTQSNFASEDARRLITAAFPQMQIGLSVRSLQMACPKCKGTVRVIPNPLEPWIHVSQACGTLVTVENVHLVIEDAMQAVS